MNDCGRWAFYDPGTGALSGSSFYGHAMALEANTPAGQVAIRLSDGAVLDHLSQRVDLQTGIIVGFQPPPPASTDLATWEWDASAKRWIPVATIAALAAAVRAERAVQLAASDWTQLADSAMQPAARGAWASYRQALRDVSSQPGFPRNVVWPTPPG